MTDFEKWKDISGYEGLYRISNKGNIKRMPKNIYNNSLLGNNKYYKCKEKILTPHDNGGGYYIVTLTKNRKRKTLKVHRLVAETFIPNPENKPQVNHINGIKTDNRVENLEWNTNIENHNHAIKIGLINKTSYEKSAKSKWKKILQFDIKGNFIKEWESMKAICKYLNIKNNGNIVKCCQGKIKKVYGYVWKYK